MGWRPAGRHRLDTLGSGLSGRARLQLSRRRSGFLAVGGLPRAGKTEFLSAVRGTADVPIQPFLGADGQPAPIQWACDNLGEAMEARAAKTAQGLHHQIEPGGA